ncbi:hypothetical protein L2E82_28159 [Cichorium intybus]|uniref:Uncharacterized protein n=1 Tax=Cichorium intybus TaxID=13427 RepID=A0ACB9CV95_CICIN|nr:hypothetical protein L2E82_28159 [Cichorium intybus]
MAIIGKASLDLAELASKTDSPVIEKKLPVVLEVAGLTTQSTISVNNSVTFDSDGTSGSRDVSPPRSSAPVQPDPDKKVGLFNWKRQHLNHRLAKSKVDDFRPTVSSSGESLASGSKETNIIQNSLRNTWEARDFVSRDEESKLNTQSFCGI